MFIPVYRGRSSHTTVCSVCGHREGLTDQQARLWLMRTGGDEDGRVLLSAHLGSAEQRIEVARAWLRTVEEMPGDAPPSLSGVTASHDRRAATAIGDAISRGLAQRLSIAQEEAEAIVFEDRFDPSFYVDENGQAVRDNATSNRMIDAANREAKPIY